MLSPLFALLCISVPGQGVNPKVSAFISQFSLAATEVELRPDARGHYLHRKDLANTLIDLRETDEKTLKSSFEFLDRNQSMRRLVAGDLLLLLIFDIPKGLDFSHTTNTALRDVFIPTGMDSAVAEPRWPWIQVNAQMQLAPFSVVAKQANQSLLARLKLFESRFKRGKL